MDQIVKIEIVLEFTNTLIGKANFLGERQMMEQLVAFRRNVYHSEEDFNYDSSIAVLKRVSARLELLEQGRS